MPRRFYIAPCRHHTAKLAYRSLGDLALDAGRTADAIADYRARSGFTLETGEKIEDEYPLGLASAQGGAADGARMQKEKLLILKPEYAPAAEFLKRLRGGPGWRGVSEPGVLRRFVDAQPFVRREVAG